MDSLKGRIVAFAIVATLLPSLATAWIAYSQTKRSITDQISESLASASTQVARELELWMAEVLTDFRIFATSYEVTENLERITRAGPVSFMGMEAVGRLNDYLDAVEHRFENYRALRVVDTNGIPVTVTDTIAADWQFPVAWQDVFQNGPARFGEPYWDAGRTQQVVSAVAPVKSPDGSVLGALVVTVDLEEVRRLIQAFVPAEEASLYILTAERRPIIAFSRESTPSNRSNEATASLYDASPLPVEYLTWLGDRRVGALGQVSGPGWAVVAELPRDIAYGRINGLRNLTVLIVSFILAFVTAIAYYLAGLIVKPLNRLIDGAGAVASGDLAVDLPVLSGGEVGYLTRVFNDMVARLREGRRQLASINEALMQKNQELAQLSNTDSLTGLYNRRHLIEALESETNRAVRTKRPYSVLMIDVDHFKGFNDRYGHQLGDEALVAVGGVLQRATREVDYAARYGGEEFMVLLPETRMNLAEEVAERIRSQASALILGSNGTKACLTVSIGLAEFPQHGATFERVIQAADDALYTAKDRGRDRVITASAREQRTRA